MNNTIESLMTGQKLYQRRARKVLPLIVGHALNREKIFYSDLAKEAMISNPRNLNFVLGCIGSAIEELADKWNSDIPPIQCIVVNKSTGIPGEGISWFISKKDFNKFTPELKDKTIQKMSEDVFSFERWPEVLRSLNLKPIKRRIVINKESNNNEQDKIDENLQNENIDLIKKRLKSVAESKEVLIQINGEIWKRDNYLVGLIKKCRGYQCQICGYTFKKKNGGFYTEGAHIIEKRTGRGKETPDNIIILCPNHHKEFDLSDKEIIERTKQNVKFKMGGKEYSINLSIE